MLRALAGDGRDLVVVGDPDQSIYAFRGADVAASCDFPDRFPHGRRPTGRRLALRTVAPGRAAAARRVAAGGRPARRCRAVPASAPRPTHRALEPRAGAAPARSRSHLFATQPPRRGDRRHAAPRAPGAAAALGRDGGAGPLGRPRRSRCCAGRSGAAGVPVEVAGDELPLAHEPAVAPLLLALRVGSRTPTRLDAEAAPHAAALARSAARPRGLRRLGRALRPPSGRGGRAATAAPAGRLPRPSAELVRDALADPRGCSGSTSPTCAARPVGGSAAARARRRDVLDAGGAADEACGRSGTAAAWPAGWPRAAAGGPRRALGRPRPRRRGGAVRRRPPGRAGAARRRRPRAARHRSRPRRSRRTRLRGGAPAAATPYACSPRTGPRAWSGTSSSSPVSRTGSGPTCAVVARCWRSGRLATGEPRRRPRPRPCSSTSAGCSTSRSRGPASGSSSPPSTPPRTTATDPRASSASSALRCPSVPSRPGRRCRLRR